MGQNQIKEESVNTRSITLILLLAVISFGQGLRAVVGRIERLEAQVAELNSAEKEPSESQEDDGQLQEIRSELDKIILDIEMLKITQEPEDYSEEIALLQENISKLEKEIEQTLAELAKEEEKGLSSVFSFKYNLDFDVWADNHGNYYKNDYSKLFFNTRLSDRISLNIGMYVNEGGIPAGGGMPSSYWFNPEYWGAWLIWKKAFDGCDVTLGDIRAKYGKFSYYGLKTKSMILGTRYMRGFMLSKDFGGANIDLLAGPLNRNNVFGTSLRLGIPITDQHNVNVYTSFDFDQTRNGRPFWSGLEYEGTIGTIDVKADFGYAGVAENDGINNATTILIEPSASLGEDGSIAASFFWQDDKSGIWGGSFDNMFFYLEPGYSVKPSFALGLPLEYHDPDMDVEDDESIWIVPTAYVYPIDGAEVWFWAMASKPMADGVDTEFSVGLELIIKN